MSKKKQYELTSEKIDPCSVTVPISFEYNLDKTKTYISPGSHDSSRTLNSNRYIGAFLPGASMFKVREILSMFKRDDEIFFKVIVPEKTEPIEMSLNVLRQLCPQEVIDFMIKEDNI